MVFWWRDGDPTVHPRVQMELSVMVFRHCVEVLVTLFSSLSEVFLTLSMIGADAREGPRCLLVTKALALAYCSLVVFYPDAAGHPNVSVAHVKLFVITALRFDQRTLYVVEDKLALHSSLKRDNGVLMHSLSAFVADIHKLGMLNIVRHTQFDAITCMGAFDHLRDLASSTIGLSSAMRYLLYRHANGTVLSVVNR